MIYTLWKISFFDNTDFFFVHCNYCCLKKKKNPHGQIQWHILVRLRHVEPKVKASLSYKASFKPVRIPQWEQICFFFLVVLKFLASKIGGVRIPFSSFVSFNCWQRRNLTKNWCWCGAFLFVLHMKADVCKAKILGLLGKSSNSEK